MRIVVINHLTLDGVCRAQPGNDPAMTDAIGESAWDSRVEGCCGREPRDHGSGQRLFDREDHASRLRLRSSDARPGGVIIAVYGPA